MVRISIRPIQDPSREIDVTRRLVAAVAEELWLAFGGNEQLNWLEAEMHVARLMGRGERAEPEGDRGEAAAGMRRPVQTPERGAGRERAGAVRRSERGAVVAGQCSAA